jgi:hypothetical protein
MGKKFYIIKPKNGLCNQLMSISKGIILGIINNRDVIFNGFQLDYKNFDNICSFEKIIDIKNLQKILDKNNIDIRVYSRRDINGIKLQINDESLTDIATISNILPILNSEFNIEPEYLDIGCPISTKIPDEYQHIINYIDNNIKFTDYFINITKEIKKKLKLNEYICIHIRLEDDSINFMKEQNNNLSLNEINTIYKNKYIEELDNLKLLKKKIYACTSLGINNNINNIFYDEIKKKYNIIDKNDIMTLDNEIKNKLLDFTIENDCREIYGIIDFLIAKESLLFIGSDWSSFSIYIHSYHLNKLKESRLINIFKTIIEL